METDEQIYLRYVKEDNDEDLETLLIRYREGLFLFLLGFVRNEEDAEDLLMDTFAKLAVDKPHFVPEHIGSFKSWLYTIARRNALMHIRKRKYETAPLDENIPSDADISDIIILKEERNRKLYQAMSAIKPEYRRVLYLLYMENLSHEEISKVMGMNKRQIYNLVDRGKKSLKNILERMGITDAEY
ncbi:MAG: RNA polymerase sigma factor [Eubacterium sp.]|nr:RNA polymerase sigma factor [Eubacterium sp.]